MSREASRDIWDEAPYAQDKRVIQVIPADPGWQTVEYVSGFSVEEAKTLPLGQLCLVEPIIGWAVSEQLSGGVIYTVIDPIRREDVSYVAAEDNADRVLCPGEDLDEVMRSEMVRKAETDAARNGRRMAAEAAAAGQKPSGRGEI